MKNSFFNKMINFIARNDKNNHIEELLERNCKNEKVITEYKSKLKNLENRFADYWDVLDERDNFRRQMIAIEKSYKELDTRLKNVQSDLANQQKENKNLNTENCKLLDSVSSIKSHSEIRNKEITKLLESTEARNKEIVTLSSESKQLLSEKKEFTKEIKDLKEKLKNIENENAELFAERDKLQDQLNAKDNDSPKEINSIKKNPNKSDKIEQSDSEDSKPSDTETPKEQVYYKAKPKSGQLLCEEKSCDLSSRDSLDKVHAWEEKIEGSSITYIPGLNIGTRRKDIVEDEDFSIFEYLGSVGFKTEYSYKSISEELSSYATVYCPLRVSNVLNFVDSNGAVQGVTESLLYKELNKLKSVCNEIELYTNKSLPVKQRNYGYKPDIVLSWKKYNLLIDIEIDEPYDAISRKPLHYIGGCDDLRNRYFVDNGWVVMRFAERQVMEQKEGCLNELAKYLNIFSESKIFDPICDTFQELVSVPRWTNKEAQLMAEQKVREGYLGIEFKTIKSEPLSAQFTGLSPDEDILTSLKNEYVKLVNEAKSVNGYIKCKDIDTTFEFILKDVEIKKYGFDDYLVGNNVVGTKSKIININCISHLQFLKSPYKSSKVVGRDNIEKALKEVVESFGFAEIEYTKFAGTHSVRSIGLVCFGWLQADQSVTDQLRINAIDGIKTDPYITCVCYLREELRTFLVSRIESLQIYNFTLPKDYLYLSWCFDYLTDAKKDMLEHNLDLAVEKLSKAQKIEKLPLLTSIYEAHKMLLSGEVKEALDIYQEHIDDYIDVIKSPVKKLITDDFKEFKENGYDEFMLNDSLQKIGISQMDNL